MPKSDFTGTEQDYAEDCQYLDNPGSDFEGDDEGSFCDSSVDYDGEGEFDESDGNIPIFIHYF